MRVKNIHTGSLGHASQFNVSSVSEIVVNYDGGDASSEYQRDYEVQLADGRWIPFNDAIRAHHLITDNYNTCFFEPSNEHDRIRGFA